jgi:hypothetical protein
MKRKKYEGFILLIIFVISLSFLISGCDKYQSETYEISAIDARACAQIQDTLYNAITTMKLTDFNSEWINENVPQNVPAILDSLKSNGIIVSEGDLSTWVTTIAEEDTNYACFQTNLNSAIFFSDEIVTLKLMDTQGNVLAVSNENMPMETVGGCLTENNKPQIRTRIEYSTPETEYLLWFVNQEQTFVEKEDDEPIIILSIQ